MLIATPYRDFDVRDRHPPKVISEIRKSYGNCSAVNLGPKMTGDLLVKCGSDRNWWPRRVHIRGGQLLVTSSTAQTPDNREEKLPSIRLPLRHLSLQAGPLPNSLALSKGQNVVLTVQTLNEANFDEWVKAIAIELIRQTPIDAIKYLDILAIAACWKQIKTQKKHQDTEKDWNFNNVDIDTTDSKTTPPCETCLSNTTQQNTSINDNNNSFKPITNKIVQEREVEDLLKKCQNVENYVPVKEKLFLFETLCKVGRKVRSTEDVSARNVETSESTKRARSMHDLSNINSHIAVREICKYFENKSDTNKQVNNFHTNSNNCKNTILNHKRLLSVNEQNFNDNVYKFRKVITT